MMTTSAPPPPLDEPLSTFFAVQPKPREHAVNVVEAVMRAAKSSGVLFRHLELLDTITIGTTPFVRMRTETTSLAPILDQLYSDGRSCVSAKGGEYVARLQGGRVGKVPQALMHATAKMGQSRMFRGPKFKFWDRQFEAA